MKIITRFLLFIIVFQFTYGNDYSWEYIDTPEGQIINKFHFDNRNKLYINSTYYYNDGYAKFQLECLDSPSNWNTIYEDYLSLSTAIKNSIFYAGTLGKMERSTNYGQTWETLNDTLPISFIHTIDISPDHSIFIGANGGSQNPFSNYLSSDGGYSWTQLTLPYQAKQFLFGDNGRYFASVVSGTYPDPPKYIYRSNDYGYTWEQLEATHRLDKWMISINDQGELYGITNSDIDSLNGVFLSRDNGDTWHKLNGNLPDNNFSSILIDNNNNIYVSSLGNGVFISNNDGKQWEMINNGLNNLNVTAIGISHDNEIFVSTKTGNSQIDSSCVYKLNHSSTFIHSNQYVGEFNLYQNFPNPFNPITHISFYVQKNGSFVTLKVFDILGNEISVLIDKNMPAGHYNAIFNGEGLSSGIYLYKIQIGDYSKTRKMLLSR